MCIPSVRDKRDKEKERRSFFEIDDVSAHYEVLLYTTDHLKHVKVKRQEDKSIKTLASFNFETSYLQWLMSEQRNCNQGVCLACVLS